jgi:hypothetical protein
MASSVADMGGAKETKTTTGAATVARSGEGCRAHVESVQTTSQAGGPYQRGRGVQWRQRRGWHSSVGGGPGGWSKRNAAGGLVLPLGGGGCRPCVGMEPWELTCETAVLGGIAKEVGQKGTDGVGGRCWQSVWCVWCNRGREGLLQACPRRSARHQVSKRAGAGTGTDRHRQAQAQPPVMMSTSPPTCCSRYPHPQRRRAADGETIACQVDGQTDGGQAQAVTQPRGVIGVIGGQQRAMKRRPPVAPQVGPVSIPRPRAFPPGRCGAAHPPIVSLRPALIKHSPFLSSPPSPPSPPPDQRSTSPVSASAPVLLYFCFALPCHSLHAGPFHSFFLPGGLSSTQACPSTSPLSRSRACPLVTSSALPDCQLPLRPSSA